jgi:hypothetical protein
MTGSRREWIVLAVLLGVMVAAAAFLGGQGGEDAAEPGPNPSSYNAKASGTKGLFVWLQELGFRVRRWEQPLTGLPGDARVLLVFGPRRAIDDAELKALERWVAGGRILALADDGVGAPIPNIRPGPPLLTFGLRGRYAGKPGELRPAFPSPYVEGVQTIAPTGPVRFQREKPDVWAPLFGDASGDVVGIRRLGRGTVIAIADPGLFSNARVETADHARLILNIVRSHAGGGQVLVDEFHHGHGEQDGFMAYMKRTALPGMLAQAALLLLLLVVARGTRFGPPVAPATGARASSLEYVEALGDLHQRARARRVAAEALAGSLRRRLVGALGSRPGEDAARLAGRAARQLRVKEAQVRLGLRPGPKAVESDEELVTYARGIHTLERRLRRRHAAPGAGRS